MLSAIFCPQARVTLCIRVTVSVSVWMADGIQFPLSIIVCPPDGK